MAARFLRGPLPEAVDIHWGEREGREKGREGGRQEEGRGAEKEKKKK